MSILNLNRLPFDCFILFFSFFITASAAGENNLRHKGPPSTYHLNEIRLRFTHHPGNPAFPIERISLSGGDGAIFERGGQSARFPIAKQDLLNVVNELYAIRFFELPSDYTAQYSVVEKENGLIGTMASSMDDQPSTSVCFSITNYKKCVIYSRKGPPELENMVQRVFSKANEWIEKK